MRHSRVASCGNRQHSPLRQAVGVLATFVASGLMHGLIIMYLCGKFGWKNALFFVVHGCAVLLERFTKETLGKTSMVKRLMHKIPRWIFIFYTLGILHLTSHSLFWPEVLGLSGQIVKSINFFETTIGWPTHRDDAFPLSRYKSGDLGSIKTWRERMCAPYHLWINCRCAFWLCDVGGCFSFLFQLFGWRLAKNMLASTSWWIQIICTMSLLMLWALRLRGPAHIDWTSNNASVMVDVLRASLYIILAAACSP